jgi:SAM-dependent methyltransferase
MTGSDLAPADPPAGHAEWDTVYEAAEQIWSGNPNGVLVAEAADLTPGSALDVGCGEGADVVWLAQQGWQVTGLDVSAKAIARATSHVTSAGVSVNLVHAGLLDFADTSTPPQFDLVNAQYPALLREQGRSLAALLSLVAPGGTLLFVHHSELSLDHEHKHGDVAGGPDFDPADYVLPAEVRDGLGDGWTVDVFEERPRHVATGAGAGHTTDVVLRARKTG